MHNEPEEKNRTSLSTLGVLYVFDRKIEIIVKNLVGKKIAQKNCPTTLPH